MDNETNFYLFKLTLVESAGKYSFKSQKKILRQFVEQVYLYLRSVPHCSTKLKE